MISRLLIKILIAAALFAVCSAPSHASVNSARVQFDAGKYTDAIATLKADEDHNSNDPDVYYWLAKSEFELRDFEAAIKYGEHACELSPANSEYHHMLGRAYGRKAEHASWFSGLSLAKKVHAEFERAVELDSRNIGARRDLVNYDARAPGFVGGGEEKAQEQIAAIDAIDPLEGHLARKDLYAEKKELDRAADECKAVMAANPKSGDFYVEVADFYAHRDNGSAVLDTLAEARRNGITDRRFDFFIGAAAALTGQNTGEGEAALQRYIGDVPARSGQPSRSDAHLWLGRLYEASGKRDDAITEYHAAIKADQYNRAAHEALKRAGG